ncbi:MAG: hypothetical protein AAF899_03060 [Pseudomonadota bacterium]
MTKDTARIVAAGQTGARMADDDGKGNGAEVDLSLLSLLGPFNDAIKKLVEQADASERQARSAVTVETGRGPMTAETEIRIRVGLAGTHAADGTSSAGSRASARSQRAGRKPAARKPKPARPSAKPAKTARPEPRKASRPAAVPSHEMIEDGDQIIVTAEAPGADPAGVSISVEDGRLQLQASGARTFALSLDLPAEVEPSSLVWSCEHGLIDVTLTRRATDIAAG